MALWAVKLTGRLGSDSNSNAMCQRFVCSNFRDSDGYCAARPVLGGPQRTTAYIGVLQLSCRWDGAGMASGPARLHYRKVTMACFSP